MESLMVDFIFLLGSRQVRWHALDSGSEEQISVIGVFEGKKDNPVSPGSLASKCLLLHGTIFRIQTEDAKKKK